MESFVIGMPCPNPIGRANAQKRGEDGLLLGQPLKRKVKSFFDDARYLRFEVLDDWLPNDDCNVSLNENYKDKWAAPVARIKIGNHPHGLRVGRYLARKGYQMRKATGAANASWGIGCKPPVNLIAGGCWFSTNPRRSVLDSNCRAHDIDNLYVTDGSFMPTGGSVP